jgi:hypothetical protein
MPMSLLHRVEERFDKLKRNVLVEQVGHTVDEYPPRSLPCQRERDQVTVQGDREATCVPGISHRMKSMSQTISVAVFAPLRDFVTSRDGVPRRLGPLNWRRTRHDCPIPNERSANVRV